MRFMEIRGGIQIPVSIEEQGLVDLIESKEEKVITLDEMDERQQELARKLVSRGVLDRTTNEGTLYFMVSRLTDLWR